jgi:hypothetical protein
MPSRILLLLALGAVLSIGHAQAEEPEGLAADTRIDEVQIDGLWRAKPFVVTRELPWKAGEVVTPEQWQLGLDRLWNMSLFSRVNARVITDGERKIAKLDLEERFTLNPLFKYAITKKAGGDTVWWLRVGLSDNNLFGRFIEFGAQYERFGSFNGGQFWLKQPRLFDRRLIGLFQIERLARPRPGFVVFRALARFEVSGEVHDRLAFLGRTDFIADSFQPPVSDEPPTVPRSNQGALLTAGVRFGRVDLDRLRHKRWQLQIQPTLGLTNDAAGRTFGQVWSEFLWFLPFGSRGTVALRVQGAAMTHAGLQNRYYIGGLDLVRGLPDNAIRTNAFGLGNFEVRFIAFDSMLLALVPTLFVDGVIAAGDDGGPMRSEATAGGGCRFLIPRLVATGMRVDVAVPLRGGGPQASVGVYQFF